MNKYISILIMLFTVSFLLYSCKSANVSTPINKVDKLQKGEIDKLEKATFAAGCFWGVEDAFRNTKGVIDTAVGYTGGFKENPTYKDVCSGKTGHAESVLVNFDPSKVSYNELLDVFWKIHDPTTLDRQGPDIGHQYRSAIFYHNEKQKADATESMNELQSSGKYSREIVTEISPATTFYMAEDYHQQYLEKNGLASCAIK
jgi:peptide-methionine (S)-S-oxide reductase